MSLGRWWRRLRQIRRASALDREMDEEMRFHLEMEAAELRSGGLEPGEARRQARLRFGGVTRHQDDGREARGILWARDFLNDARYALRTLRRAPVFAITAILTLAIGVGASATIFAFTDVYVFRPLPFPHGDRLVELFDVQGPGQSVSASLPEFEDWRAGAREVEAMVGAARYGYTYLGPESAERVMGAMVSSGYFALLGERAIVGRDFQATDDAQGAPPVVIVSRAFWMMRLAGSRDAVGRTLTLDGRPYSVIGVADRGLETFATPTQVFLPLEPNAPSRYRGTHFLAVFGRLKAGAALAAARADLSALAGRLDAQYHTGHGITASPLKDKLVGDARGALLALLASVGFLLLIAIANLAGLLQARASARSREYAVRAALGAGRGRLVRQTLAEVLLLSALGAAVGVLGALGGTRLLLGLWPASLPRPLDVTVHARVLAFAIACALVAGVVSALSPGLVRLSVEALRQRAAGLRRHRVHRLLVSGEVALTVVLLVGSGLMIRSLERLLAVEPGFEPTNVMTLSVSLPASGYGSDAERRAFFDGLLDRLGRVPGVREAGAATNLPFSGTMNGDFVIEGQPPFRAGEEPSAEKHIVTPGYFQAMRIPLLRGRLFTPEDRDSVPRAAIINDAMARRFWPGEDPIGRRIRVLGPGWQEIVGVVGDVRLDGLDRAPRLETYTPFDQSPSRAMTIVVRHDAGRAAAVVIAVRTAVREMDRSLPVYGVLPLSEVVSQSVARQRVPALLLVGFAAIALLLAAVGIYGLLAYAVTQRTSEIAVRMALGAEQRTVVREVLGEGMRLVAAGAAAGVALALGLSQLIARLLFQVRPLDLPSYLLALLVLGLVAVTACVVPAYRAARVDPIRALQSE